jgi:uncharacterized SAM-binding protein YcdF (DUF218 family)
MSEPYAIVVLGATVEHGRPLPTLCARLDAGAAAFRQHRAPRIIVTGRGEAEPMQRYLVERGIPAEAIELEKRARNTLENAVYVAEMLPRGVHVVLVTQHSHQRRAQALFAAQGMTTEPLMPDEPFNPYRIVRERIAFLLYRLCGWV